MDPRYRLLALAAASLAAWSPGCGDGAGGPGRQIVIVRQRPPALSLPGDVRRIAVGCFTTAAVQADWADAAADLLEEHLTRNAGERGRYQIVPRRPAAGSAAPTGTAEAVIGGRVEVSWRHWSEFAGVAGGKATRPRQLDRFVCTVTVDFAVSRPDGQTLLARRLTRDYDSAAQANRAPPKPGKPTRAVIADLLAGCVREFVGQFFPVQTVARVSLLPGESARLVEGSELAAAGKYGDALAQFERALEESPDDEAALFNAALMYELLGRFAQAERRYRQAYQSAGSRPSLEALRRVEGLRVSRQAAR